jgi:hypothetical protein
MPKGVRWTASVPICTGSQYTKSNTGNTVEKTCKARNAAYGSNRVSLIIQSQGNKWDGTGHEENGQ